MTRALSYRHHHGACRKQLILVLGQLSQAPPGIPKDVSCVLAHLPRGLSLSRFVRLWHISGEPEVLSGTSLTWVSKDKSESNLTLKSSHIKCFVLRRVIRNLPFISDKGLQCQQRYLGVGLCPVTPGDLSGTESESSCIGSPLR